MPRIRWVYIPNPEPAPNREAEFGLIGLEDGSGGFFYAWLGEGQSRLRERFDPAKVISRSPLELVGLYQSVDEGQRSIGLAAINAISQHVLQISGFELDTSTDSMAHLSFASDDRVGMVGLFPSLAKQLCVQGVCLVVVERKPHLVQTDQEFEVTLDASRLSDCNKVLCTGATLLNDTLDDILGHCRSADAIALIGPTASCLPDPLFERGIDVVGGAVVTDMEELLHRMERNESFGSTVQKYAIRHQDYPGISQLLERLDC